MVSLLLYHLTLVANRLFSQLREVARLSSGTDCFSGECHLRREEVKVSIEEYSKSECLTLCSMMQEMMPRELRDMVYEALLREPQNYYVDGDGRSLEDLFPANVVLHNPHIGDKLFVGEKTLTELADMWYRHSVFRLFGDSTVACLFRNESWELPDLDPAPLIRHVYMTLNPRERWDNMWDEFVETGKELHLPSDFEQLAKLQQPATFTIGTYFEDWNYHGKTREGTKTFVDTMSRRVFPVLKQLIASGVGVTVRIYEAELKVGLEHLDSETWSKLVRGVHPRQ